MSAGAADVGGPIYSGFEAQTLLRASALRRDPSFAVYPSWIFEVAIEDRSRLIARGCAEAGATSIQPGRHTAKARW